jgi:energy-coupling factor transport system substrate-specific component
MTWEAGVITLLALMLLGGFVWYERSRPPAQIVALVAALAAISVAGRVAFSPIPNVVPTTDITLIAGYALGGAPGFAVGALSALVSNFWLGQGPWTPWQMAGWGLTGLAGAGLAVVTGRRLGRIPLAVVCALAGFAYGALLDFSVLVTYGGEQSLDRYLALSARGLPFNIAHAAGNAALALVAGPAMVRMLLRYRERFEFAWRRSPADRVTGVRAGVAGLLAALLIAAVGFHPEPRADAAPGGPGAAAAWLQNAQNGDGGFGFGPGEPSSVGMTGWASLGLEAAGINPLDVDKGDASPITYLSATAGQLRSAGDLERTILAVRGAGLDPRRFGGHDLVGRLISQRGADGSWEAQVNLTAFGIFALRGAGVTRGLGRSAAWLRSHQNADGGWGFSPGTPSDADSTGAVLEALAAAGSRDGIQGGVSYLRAAQRPGGGFPLSGGAVNAQSTAYATQGLLAAGVPPSSVRKGGRSPLDYLASMQARDGHYRYSAASDQTPVWVTAQALLAVNGAAFPLSPVPQRTTTGASRSPATTGGSSPTQARGEAKGKKAGENSAAQPAGSGATTPTTPVPLAPVSSGAGSGDDDDGGVPGWLIALLLIGAGGGAIWGGWLLYRRRLPG